MILEGKRRGLVSVVGSCNGLLCLKFQWTLMLYNPSIRSHRNLIDFQPQYSKCGLGSAESIDDYKYVKNYDDVKSIWVYSLRKDSMVVIKCDFQFSTIKGVPLNGALHWLAYHDRASPNLFIVAFDLDEEKFKTFPLPDNVITKDNHDWAYSFGICGGCLCLLIEKEYPALQLWIMKEYCVKRSWTKISTVEGHRSLAELDYEQVLFWDPIDAEFKNIYEEGVETSDNIPYVESLVSPHYRNDFTNDEKLLGYL